jgi:thioredoxin 1
MSELIKAVESESEFDSIIKSGIVLIDFFATWCAPCRQQALILEKFAPSVENIATIVKVDTENCQALAQKFGIEHIPTLILFKDGNIVTRFTGVQQASILQDAITRAVSNEVKTN